MQYLTCSKSLVVLLMIGGSTICIAQNGLEQQEAIQATIIEKSCPDDGPNSSLDCVGTMTYKNGNVYEGAIQKGQRQGFGKMIYANGDVFEGNWKNDEQEQEGSMIFANGNEYLGSFANGEIEGTGSMMYDDGSSYSGEWTKGQRDGAGEMIRSDKSHFDGHFNEGNREGPGRVIWESGDTLSGIWIDDELDGKSIYKFGNGDQLICSWANGNLKVRAVYQFLNGKEIKGTLKEIREEALQEFDLIADDTEGNFQRAWLGFAMEYKEIGAYDLAADFLLSAQQFATIEDECSQQINVQLGAIKKYQRSGFARLPLSTDRSN